MQQLIVAATSMHMDMTDRVLVVGVLTQSAQLRLLVPLQLPAVSSPPHTGTAYHNPFAVTLWPKTPSVQH
jgi:hypothetical protein